MRYPELTAIYGAILAIIYVALSFWVIAGRLQRKVNLGEGQDPEMQVRVRAHANFIEYVPLALILVGLFEMAHGSRILVHVLLIALIVARLIHPFGLRTAPQTPQQFATRGAPIMVTLLVILVAAVALLLRLA